MRLLPPLYKARGRAPQKEPVPFQQILPLALKPTVSGKGNRTSDVACLQEMSILFACLKEHDFDQSLCKKEVDEFQGCFKEYLVQKNKRKEDNRQGTLVPGERNMNYKMLNKVLKNYPPMP